MSSALSDVLSCGVADPILCGHRSLNPTPASSETLMGRGDSVEVRDGLWCGCPGVWRVRRRSALTGFCGACARLP